MIDIVNGLLILLLGVYVGKIVIKRLTDLYIEIKDKLGK
ncbi:hypothetical protein J2T50_000277 [Streptococcus gallinaceus]|nr:hypothetical protein [Streptococcus gallinaceus]MCP1769329.1 hypothetical protein [Streptococcus gallinaceus]